MIVQQFFDDINLLKRQSIDDDYRKITVPSTILIKKLLDIQRRKTDFWCAVLYYILTMILLGVAFYSFITEQDRKYWEMRDSDQVTCGQGSANQFKYLYYPTPLEGQEGLKNKLCVNTCPKGQQQYIPCLINSKVKQCPSFTRGDVYKTQQIQLLKICKPDNDIIKQGFEAADLNQGLFVALQNLYDSKYIIAFVCPFVCLIILIIFMLISTSLNNYGFFYGIVTFGTMFMCLFLAYYFFQIGLKHPQYHAICIIISFILVTGVIIASSLLIYSVLFGNNVFNRLVLLKFASLYLKQNISVIIMQISAFVIWMVTFILWITIFIWIFFITQPRTSKYELINLNHSTFIKVILCLGIFHFIWTNFIIYSTFSYITYAASSNWILRFPNYLNLALYRALKFHFGTIVYGALFVPISTWLSDVLFLLMPSPQGVCFCCVFKPWLNFYQTGFFKNFLSNFSEKNYVATNIFGHSFCKSGRTLIPILVDNISSVQYSYKVAKAFVISARYLMAFVTTLICSFIMSLLEIQIHTLTLLIMFSICIILGSFLSSSYQKTYESILITVFLADDRMKKMQEKGYYIEYLINAFTLHKQKPEQVYNAVEKWFIQQALEQKQMKNMV